MSWPVVRLGDLVTIKGGGTPSKKSDEYWGGNIPWASVKDLKSNLISTTQDFITELGVEKSATNLIPSGTILTATRMALGRFAINTVDMAINQDLKALFINDKSMVDRDYLFRFLESIAHYIDGEGKGATVKGITLDFLKSIEIPLPPLAEQKRIAAILDKADSIRQKRKQAIDLADDLLRSVFLDMFGDPVNNPKGWAVDTLKELSTKILSGNTPKGGSNVYVEEGISFFRSQNVWKNKILLDDIVYIDKETHSKMSKSSLKHKDILMTKTGRINTENSSLGRAALFLGEDGSANLNGHVYLIRLAQGVLHEFVVFILTMTEYRDYIRSVCVGGIDKRQINKEHLEEFPIIAPPIELQKSFIAKVKVAKDMTESGRIALLEAEQMFNSLSQKAFAGEL